MTLKWMLIVCLILINIVTYQAYRYDKRNAQLNGPSKVLKYPRISERMLHMLSLIGGWPGALIAQQTLRHKTIKQPFQRNFWITVIINIIFLLVVTSHAS